MQKTDSLARSDHDHNQSDGKLSQNVEDIVKDWIYLSAEGNEGLDEWLLVNWDLENSAKSAQNQSINNSKKQGTDSFSRRGGQKRMRGLRALSRCVQEMFLNNSEFTMRAHREISDKIIRAL